MASVDVVAESIRSMKVRGARDIAIAAAETLRDMVKDGATLSELKSAGERLKAARPSAVSLPNAVDYCIYLAEGNRILPEDQFKDKTAADIRCYLDELKSSLERIAKIGSELIKDGDTLLTHCQSDTVAEIFKKAYDDGKKIKVVATEARPRHQGHLTAKMLADYGIPVTLIIDSAAHYMMKKLHVDKVFVGADTITADGDVVNKVGTSQIALSARHMDIPVIVAAESLKFNPKSLFGRDVEIEMRDPKEIADLPGINVLNPAFDITEAEYVDVIVTEAGVMPPQAAYSLLREKYGWEIAK
jgi:ribose 1,5-bisphosphate isomerase